MVYATRPSSNTTEGNGVCTPHDSVGPPAATSQIRAILRVVLLLLGVAASLWVLYALPARALRP
jgi:hypothetical protein